MNANLPLDEDAEHRTTATGLARFAYEYIDAAILVDENHGERPGLTHISPMPAYFLAMHGIELTIKSFLRFRGVTVAELRGRDLGHNLRACYKRAIGLGLRDTFNVRMIDLRAMVLLLRLNEFQGLRYIRTGAKVVPSWAIVEPFAVRLHQAVGPMVGYRSFTKSYQGYE